MLQALTPEEPEERFPLSGASLDISEFKIRNGCSHYLGSVCLHRAHTSTPPPPPWLNRAVGVWVCLGAQMVKPGARLMPSSRLCLTIIPGWEGGALSSLTG